MRVKSTDVILTTPLFQWKNSGVGGGPITFNYEGCIIFLLFLMAGSSDCYPNFDETCLQDITKKFPEIGWNAAYANISSNYLPNLKQNRPNKSTTRKGKGTVNSTYISNKEFASLDEHDRSSSEPSPTK